MAEDDPKVAPHQDPAWPINFGDKIEWYVGGASEFYGASQDSLVLWRQNGDAAWVGTLSWRKIDQNAMLEPGDLLVRGHQANPKKHNSVLEDLCQALLKAGYGRDVAIEVKGELDATKNHLSDMRRLVFEFGVFPKPEPSGYGTSSSAAGAGTMVGNPNRSRPRPVD